MAGYTGNTCDILTIFPMGLICSSTNAYTPFTNDGAITLYITGATPPYTINWSNGAHSQNLTNLQSGNYTATVIDYYGDFTATTICNVGFDTFYLEKFTNCLDFNNQIYFLANINNQYQVNKVYSLSSQLGCWISEGLLLYSAETYSNFTATTVSGPFDSCLECLPTVPVIFNTSGLCLTLTSSNVVTQTQYYSGNTINGYPSWTSNTSNEVIYFDNVQSKWKVSGWTGGGIPQLQSIQSPPIGAWDVVGLPQLLAGNTAVAVTQGDCQAVIVANISSTPPSCEGATDGYITVTSVIGGTPPYTYSLVNDQNFYQVSNTFNGLSEGGYTVYVQDVFGNITISQVNLNSLVSPTQYNLNLVIQQVNAGNNTTTNQTKNWNWQVTVSPALPIGKQINFDITHVSTSIYGTTANGSPTLSYTQSTGTTGGGQYLTSTTPTTTSTTATTVACNTTNNYAQHITSTTIRQYNARIVGTGANDSVFGNATQSVTVFSNGTPCAVFGNINDSVSITNIQLVNQIQCELVNTTVQPVSFSVSKTGTPGSIGSNVNVSG